MFYMRLSLQRGLQNLHKTYALSRLAKAGATPYFSLSITDAAVQQPRKGNLAMAASDTTRSVPAAAFGTRVTSLFAALSDWNDARITRKSLSRLSARELDDIGLCRGDIEMIAAKGGRV